MLEDDLGEMPPGWEQRVTRDGVAYFVDHVHRLTTVCIRHPVPDMQFEDPRIAFREQRRKEACAHEATLPQYKVRPSPPLWDMPCHCRHFYLFLTLSVTCDGSC